MDQCSRCGAETQLYYGDIPICLDCSKAREQSNENVDLARPHMARESALSQKSK